MTPYELRFEIFKQANGFAQDKYHAAFTAVEQWNGNPKNSVMMDYPDFPSYDQIEALADKINAFVSKN
jgi:hypothetical protein